MESAKSLCKKLLNFKNTIIIGGESYMDADMMLKNVTLWLKKNTADIFGFYHEI